MNREPEPTYDKKWNYPFSVSYDELTSIHAALKLKVSLAFLKTNSDTDKRDKDTFEKVQKFLELWDRKHAENNK